MQNGCLFVTLASWVPPGELNCHSLLFCDLALIYEYLCKREAHSGAILPYFKLFTVSFVAVIHNLNIPLSAFVYMLYKLNTRTFEKFLCAITPWNVYLA